MNLSHWLATALLIPLSTPALADAHMDRKFTSKVSGQQDQITGTVVITPTASGQMMIEIDMSGLPTGTHAVHLHETGDCSGPDYTTAGGHIAADAQHGVKVEDGPHPGDLPNAEVGIDGRIQVTHFKDGLTADQLRDDDGASFVVHSGADDYETQPSGDAGGRIACGVLKAAS
jgi:Cu-Zn family superoxide dismutase